MSYLSKGWLLLWKYVLIGRVSIGKEPKVFAYPYGSFDEISERAVKKAGYNISYSIIEDMNYPNEKPDRIKRFGINSKVSPENVLKKVTLNKK